MIWSEKKERSVKILKHVLYFPKVGRLSNISSTMLVDVNRDLALQATVQVESLPVSPVQ